MIDFKYPKSIDEWKLLVNEVEEQSSYQILSGLSNILEVQNIAFELMNESQSEGIVQATENYLEKIGKLCMEDTEIGLKLYIFLLGGVKKYNIEVSNEFSEIPTEMSFKEANEVFKENFFNEQLMEGANVAHEAFDKNKEEILTKLTDKIFATYS